MSAKIIIGTTGLFMIALAGCQGTPPQWVEERITEYESEPIANPPAEIWQYDYRGDVVFYLPPSCCDLPSELYDSAGNLICAPDGGIDGGGDGQCMDFHESRSQESLVWRDERQ